MPLLAPRLPTRPTPRGLPRSEGDEKNTESETPLCCHSLAAAGGAGQCQGRKQPISERIAPQGREMTHHFTALAEPEVVIRARSDGLAQSVLQVEVPQETQAKCLQILITVKRHPCVCQTSAVCFSISAYYGVPDAAQLLPPRGHKINSHGTS